MKTSVGEGRIPPLPDVLEGPGVDPFAKDGLRIKRLVGHLKYRKVEVGFERGIEKGSRHQRQCTISHSVPVISNCYVHD